jgi:AcrR family transcriptional regulator
MNQTFDRDATGAIPDTKTRILDAAEHLFAERGYDATSLRAITAAAGANLAAVNYHFHSKEALIQAVVARKLGPLNQRRLELLDRYEAEAGRGRVPVEKILRAFLEPVARAGQESPAGWDRFRMLVGRMYSAPSQKSLAVFSRELEEVARRFKAALRGACPHLSEQDLYWRVYFTVGGMALTLSAGAILEMLSEGSCDPTDIEEGIERLIAFAVAGFKAPGTVRASRKARRRGITPQSVAPLGATKS